MLAAGVDFPLVCASAEATPFDDRSFDIVFCDWGAMTFADPYRTVPEAARVLRTGGLFAFCGGAPIVDCAWAPGADHPGDRLVVDYFGMHALREPDGSVSFQLPYGEWIRLFHEHGFAIETLLELRPGPDAAEQLPGRVRSRLGAALADGAHLAPAPDRLSRRRGAVRSGAARERVDRLPAGHPGKATGPRCRRTRPRRGGEGGRHRADGDDPWSADRAHEQPLIGRGPDGEQPAMIG